jgi:glycosyltransferase involved in cell wall biosynthesis
VVAVSEGGIRETVLHQVTGLLVEREPEQFAAAVTSLLSDPALACRLGENGRKQVLEQWTWDLATARLENHLAETASI